MVRVMRDPVLGQLDRARVLPRQFVAVGQVLGRDERGGMLLVVQLEESEAGRFLAEPEEPPSDRV